MSTASLSESDLRLIEELHLHLQVEPFDDVQSSSVIAIRHAFTEQNLDQHLYEVKRGGIFKSDEEWRDLMLNEKYLDTPLQTIGVQQCTSNQKVINEIDFEVVLVSPLRRTLQTCLHLFATHKNRANIKFIIFPLIAEGLCATSCLGFESNTNLRAISEKVAESLQIKLDFTLLDQLDKPYTWQYAQIADETIRQQASEHIKQVESEEKHRRHIISEMTRTFPEYLETWQMIFDRSKIALKEISQIRDNYPDILANKRKLGIVTHSYFIRGMTADRIEANGEPAGKQLLNCQICSITL